MNYIWNYFYGEENKMLKYNFVKETINEFYNKYKIKVDIVSKDSSVLNNKSGLCEIKYGNKSVDLMLSFKLKEFFTLGGNGMCQLGSVRDKDYFYRTVQLNLS